MTFEEFFKKKKIDLDQLKSANPALFAEFEIHYAAMGEKSFDHTKKYWFNDLRRKYHIAEEAKPEKLAVAVTEVQPATQTATPVAEQTATPPAAKLGFKPKFKSATPSAATENATPATLEEDAPQPAPESVAAPKLGFKPKFKAGMTKPVEDTPPVAGEENKTEEKKVARVIRRPAIKKDEN